MYDFSCTFHAKILKILILEILHKGYMKNYPTLSMKFVQHRNSHIFTTKTTTNTCKSYIFPQKELQWMLKFFFSFPQNVYGSINHKINTKSNS